MTLLNCPVVHDRLIETRCNTGSVVLSFDVESTRTRSVPLVSGTNRFAVVK